MKNTSCPNLWKLYGQQFKISFDEAYNSASTPWERRDPWYMTIRCRFGVVFPYGESDLAIAIDYHVITANKIASLPGCKMVQDGDAEKTIRFPLERFDEVAAFVLPYKRRQYTDEERTAIGKRLAPYAIAPGTNSPKFEPNSHSKASAGPMGRPEHDCCNSEPRT